MGLYLGGLIVRRICVSEIWRAYFFISGNYNRYKNSTPYVTCTSRRVQSNFVAIVLLSKENEFLTSTSAKQGYPALPQARVISPES